MNNNKKAVKVWVAPSFRSMLKTNAATKGVSIIDLTEELAQNKNSLVKKELKINGFWSRLI